MPTVVQDKNTSFALREFAELLKYELNIDVSVENIMDSVKYLEKRGFRVYKDKN
jgi:hypothetical protein